MQNRWYWYIFQCQRISLCWINLEIQCSKSNSQFNKMWDGLDSHYTYFPNTIITGICLHRSIHIEGAALDLHLDHIDWPMWKTQMYKIHKCEIKAYLEQSRAIGFHADHTTAYLIWPEREKRSECLANVLKILNPVQSHSLASEDAKWDEQFIKQCNNSNVPPIETHPPATWIWKID